MARLTLFHKSSKNPLDFLLFHSLAMLHFFSPPTLVFFLGDSNSRVKLSWNKELNCVLLVKVDYYGPGAHRAPIFLAQLGIPKVVYSNICTNDGIHSCLGTKECPVSCWNVSDQPTAPLHHQKCVEQDCFVGRHKAVFIRASHCVEGVSPAAGTRQSSSELLYQRDVICCRWAGLVATWKTGAKFDFVKKKKR